MIDTADTTADPDRAMSVPSLSLSFSSHPSIRNAERRNFPSTSGLPFVPATPFLPSGSGGAPSENEKAPPPEFSPVTIGSLGRGTSSGLHDAGPFPTPLLYDGPSVFLDPSCDLSPLHPFSYSSFQLQARILVVWCPGSSGLVPSRSRLQNCAQILSRESGDGNSKYSILAVSYAVLYT